MASIYKAFQTQSTSVYVISRDVLYGERKIILMFFGGKSHIYYVTCWDRSINEVLSNHFSFFALLIGSAISVV